MKIKGTALDDLLYGEDEADIIKGRAGNDTIFGLEGDDILRGNKGDDRLHGGPGDDLFIGGPGADIIDLTTTIDTSSDDRSFVSSGNDTVRGFNQVLDLLDVGFLVNDIDTGGITTDLRLDDIFDALDSNSDNKISRFDDLAKGRKNLTINLGEAINVAHEAIEAETGVSYDGPSVEAHSVKLVGVEQLVFTDFAEVG